jgi:hypothetical protein
MDLHGGLREIRTAKSIAIVESSVGLSVDYPVYLLLGPYKGVVVEVVLGSEGSVEVLGAGEISGVALAEVVGLD